MRPFIAFLRKHTDRGFLVTFPDLPHCNSTGPTIAEARANAEFALKLHCRRLQREGAPMPAPSFMHQIDWTHMLDGLVVLIPQPEAA
jgi:predicted RNase H-like HicB family nuclease